MTEIEGLVQPGDLAGADAATFERVAIDRKLLTFFVRESNRIEGITRPPIKRELQAHADMLALPELSVILLARFVNSVQPGAQLRINPGMNVRVGSHIPAPGGASVGYALMTLLDAANGGADPWDTHVAYETLHPFMDGNGRSGRAVWLWQMINQQRATRAIRMGFLHLFYYQTLQHSNRSVGGTDGSTRTDTGAPSNPSTTDDSREYGRTTLDRT